jgi:hypothetical protein
MAAWLGIDGALGVMNNPGAPRDEWLLLLGELLELFCDCAAPPPPPPSMSLMKNRLLAAIAAAATAI